MGVGGRSVGLHFGDDALHGSGGGSGASRSPSTPTGAVGKGPRLAQGNLVLSSTTSPNFSPTVTRSPSPRGTPPPAGVGDGTGLGDAGRFVTNAGHAHVVAAKTAPHVSGAGEKGRRDREKVKVVARGKEQEVEDEWSRLGVMQDDGEDEGDGDGDGSEGREGLCDSISLHELGAG